MSYKKSHCDGCGMVVSIKGQTLSKLCLICMNIFQDGSPPRVDWIDHRSQRRKKYLCDPFGLDLRDLTPEIIAALVAVLDGGGP